MGLLGLAAMPSRLPPRTRVTKVEPLPSGGVLPAAVDGTTSPSASLPARFRIARVLSVALFPDEGRLLGSLLFRVELSLRASLDTPEVSCARMHSHAPVSTGAVCCLRRVVSGSATSPFRVVISRG